MEAWEGLGSVLMSWIREKGICLLPSIFLRIRGPSLVKESDIVLRAWPPTPPHLGLGRGVAMGVEGVVRSLAVLCFVATRGLTARKLFPQ